MLSKNSMACYLARRSMMMPNPNMKIAFISVNSSYSHSGFAAWCLRAAVGEDPAWEWWTVEATIKERPETIAEKVLASAPRVVAATAYLFNREVVAAVLRAIKRTNPRCLIVVGGPECLGDNRPWVEPPGVADVAVRGEGERVFPEILRRWREGGDWRSLPGVCHLDSGVYRDGGLAVTVEDLDSIPAFHGRELAGFNKPFVQFETSRGCRNGCAFCTSRETPLRRHSLERVRADLQDIERAGVGEVRVIDRTFNDELDRAVLLVRMFRDEFPSLRFHLEVDPARFGTRLAAEFAKAAAGRFHLEAGVQSLEPAVYAAIGRKATVGRTREGLERMCSLRNIEVHIDLIAGLPGGNGNAVLRDLESVIPLAPSEIQLERLKLLPGTPFGMDPLRWGLQGSPQAPYAVASTLSMSPEDLVRTDELSRLIDWYYNVDGLQKSVIDAVRHVPGFLSGFASWVGGRGGWASAPDLEGRFRLIGGFLAEHGGESRHDLLWPLWYQWYRRGFSTRNGPCPAVPWRGPLPVAARLIEGKAGVRVSRAARVDLDVPHFFCYGTGVRGERAVVAVYRVEGGSGVVVEG